MKALIKMVKGISTVTVLGAAAIMVSPQLKSSVFPPVDDSQRIVQAFQTRESNLLVETQATVIRVYPDVEYSYSYQEFSVRLPNGHRLRVRHSLDEANRVPVSAASVIRLRGEYDWTEDGGQITWTHDDPNGQREGGWIEYNGQRFL